MKQGLFILLYAAFSCSFLSAQEKHNLINLTVTPTQYTQAKLYENPLDYHKVYIKFSKSLDGGVHSWASGWFVTSPEETLNWNLTIYETTSVDGHQYRNITWVSASSKHGCEVAVTRRQFVNSRPDNVVSIPMKNERYDQISDLMQALSDEYRKKLKQCSDAAEKVKCLHDAHYDDLASTKKQVEAIYLRAQHDIFNQYTSWTKTTKSVDQRLLLLKSLTRSYFRLQGKLTELNKRKQHIPKSVYQYIAYTEYELQHHRPRALEDTQLYEIAHLLEEYMQQVITIYFKLSSVLNLQAIDALSRNLEASTKHNKNKSNISHDLLAYLSDVEDQVSNSHKLDVKLKSSLVEVIHEMIVLNTRVAVLCTLQRDTIKHIKALTSKLDSGALKKLFITSCEAQLSDLILIPIPDYIRKG